AFCQIVAISKPLCFVPFSRVVSLVKLRLGSRGHYFLGRNHTPRVETSCLVHFESGPSLVMAVELLSSAAIWLGHELTVLIMLWTIEAGSSFAVALAIIISAEATMVAYAELCGS